VLTLSFPIQHSLRILSHSLRQEEEIKGIQVGKEEIKLSLFSDDMIKYLKESQNSTQQLLDITNSFSKIAG
jgi:hypothetical protein